MHCERSRSDFPNSTNVVQNKASRRLNFFIPVDILTPVFGGAFLVALITSKAYFRGVVVRSEDPAGYWTTMACYVVLALLIPVIKMFK